MKEGSKMVVSGWKNQQNFKSDQNKAVGILQDSK